MLAEGVPPLQHPKDKRKQLLPTELLSQGARASVSLCIVHAYTLRNPQTQQVKRLPTNRQTQTVEQLLKSKC